jgi:hypothetical protein
MTPKVLDLYCCAGGAGAGYARAGFEVHGVDVADRPNYPYNFRRREVIGFLTNQARWWLRGFALIHASPPCQKDAAITKGTNAHLRETYPDLYQPTKDLLEEIGVPYVIENPAARPDVVLCGEMFGLGVIRHRNFELGGWKMEQPKHIKHRGRVRGYRHGEWFDGPYVAAYGQGGGKATVPEMQEAMGIDWTDVREELTEAIPPAYTEYIGKHLMSFLMAN